LPRTGSVPREGSGSAAGCSADRCLSLARTPLNLLCSSDMGEEFLSCSVVGFPCALRPGVIHLRDRHAGGRGFLEGFESGNIDRKERYALGGECGAQLWTFRFWRRRDFGQEHSIAIGANIIERLERQDEAISIETRGNRGNDQ